MACLRPFAVLACSAALASCASHDSGIPLASYQTVVPTGNPTPGAGAAAAPEDYRINPIDELRIDVFGETELSLKELPVAPSGNIIMPLVGSIKAEGRTTAELTQIISTSLNHYLRHPQVAVNVTKFASQKVTVEGEVKMPGVFDTPAPITLLDAIAMGQGLDEVSKESEILVFRRQGGQQYVARFDLGMIQAGAATNPTVLPGDVVIVGYSEGRRIFKNVITVLPAAVGIFIALINR